MKKLICAVASTMAIFLGLALAAAPTATAAAPTGSSSAEPVTQHPVAVKETTAPKASLLSGSFSWSADIMCCKDSRKWSQKAGSTTISSYGICSGGVDFTKYYIMLMRDEFVDDSMGRTAFACNQALQWTWTGLRSGTYYFKIEKQDDHRSRLVASGNVYYP